MGLLIAASGQETVCGADSARDPVLEYYRNGASAAFESRDPIARGEQFSLRARTHVKHTSPEGRVERVDSAVVRCFFGSGRLDSVRVLSGNIRKPDSLPLPPLNVFADDYLFHFFPNDTGGALLAIGFDTRDDSTSTPIGLAVVDRGTFGLRRLYLHFPNDPRFKRHTRSYRFIEHEGLTFADSIWEVVTKAGIFSTDNYRVETGIDSIEVVRGGQ